MVVVATLVVEVVTVSEIVGDMFWRWYFVTVLEVLVPVLLKVPDLMALLCYIRG